VATFGGTATAADGASTTPAYHWSSAGTGSFDEVSTSASVDFGGAITWTVPSHGISIALSNPSLALAGDGSGSLAFDYVDSTGASGNAVIADLSTAGASVSVSDGVASFSNVSATLAQGGAIVFQSYPLGTSLDPVSFVLPYELAPVAVATTTSLTTSPATTAGAGTDVVLTASVSPAADGTVQFFDGANAVGSPVAVAAGTASTPASGLAVGSHSFTAEFTPTDSTLYTPSSSTPVDFSVTAAPTVPAVATSLSVAAAPAAPVTLGSAVAVSATVTPADAVGTVEFFDIAPGGAPVSLGSAVVSAGTASLSTKSLAAGGHTFSATFVPADPTLFEPSTKATNANYGVVDATKPASCAPAASSSTLADVTATWDWSAYSSDWNKSATGAISVSDETFTLAGGSAAYDASCAVVSFTGSMTALAYPGLADAWITLTDPVLSISADGTGTWSADVTTFENSVPKRLVVATISNATLPNFAVTNSAVITLDFAGTTAPGTWAVLAAEPRTAYTEAWSNEFVLAVPTSIRSFYYKSSESAAQAKKPASPLNLAWTAVTPEVPEVPATEGDLVWGFKESWRNYLAAFGGTSTATGGATEGADGLFTFSQAETGSFDPETGLGSIDYVGTVRFVNASHGFDIALVDPRVTFTESGAVLSAEVSTSDTGGVSSLARIDVATLAIPAGQPTGDDTLVWSSVPATFTDSLTSSWAQYEGQAADPVSFRYGIPAEIPAEPRAVTVSAPSIAQGGAVTFTGSGFDPGELITATVYSDPVALGTKAASAAGVLAYDWTVPADFETGAHRVEFVGADGVAVTADFEVTAVVPLFEAPAAAPAAQVCVAADVSGATLTWGVKESFRSYIAGPIAKGAVSQNGTGTSGSVYVWSGGSGTYNQADSLGRVSYDGSVTFTGHAGKLDLTIANPSIQVNGPGSASLIAHVTSKALSGPGVDATVTLATLALPDGVVADGSITWSDASATLTAAGAQAFGGFYQAGVALDPVSFSFPLGEAVPCDAYSDSSEAAKLARTGAGVDALWVALALMLAGGVVLTVRRRRGALV
jgi:hypothetical protein